MMGRMAGWARIASVAALAAAAASAATDELELSFHANRITVVAADVPLDTILGEWARLGDTRFVAANGLPTWPVSVHLVDVPEREALRVLLRATGGYIAESRSARQPGLSAFERVLIMTGGGRRAARPHADLDRVRVLRPQPPRARALPGAPAAGAEADDDEDTQEDDLDDLELLESLRRRYESAAQPADDPRPTFFPLPAPGAATAPGPPTAPRPGVILQPDAPVPQPRAPSDRPRRRTGAPPSPAR